MNKTKMLNAALASTLCVLLSGGLVSCKDYRDDISHLEKEVDGLKSQINQIDAKIQAGKTIKAVKEVDGGVKITLSDNSEYTIAGSKKGENGKSGSVVTIGENGNWFIDGKDTNKPSKGVKGDKGDKGDAGAYYYPGTTGEEKGFWVKKDGEKKEITKDKWLFDGVVTAVYKNGVVTLSNVEGANGDVVFGALEISEVSLAYNTANLAFSSTPAVGDVVFAKDVEGAVTFVKGKRLADDGVDVILKVNPVNVDLSKMLESIKLIRMDANTEVNEYVVATKAVRATAEDLADLTMTRSMPTQTGLWKVTFDLNPESDFVKFKKLTEAGTKVVEVEYRNPAEGNPLDNVIYAEDEVKAAYYRYAVAIESSAMKAAAAEDRFVASEFELNIDATARAPHYDLYFEVMSPIQPWTKVTDIMGRVKNVANKDQVEYVWTLSPLKAVEGDNRTANVPLPVVLNKDIVVSLNVNNPTSEADKELMDKLKGIYGFYITLDEEAAVDVSELNAWKSYDYEGLNKIYKATEKAVIKVKTPKADGDVIGFRIRAINWDGTLVDPDGRSFYVTVGSDANVIKPVALTGTPINETVNDGVFSELSVEIPKLVDAKYIVLETSDKTLKVGGVEPVDPFGIVITAGQTLITVDPNAVPQTDDKVIKLSKKTVKIKAVAKAASWLAYEDDKVYNGILKIKNSEGIVLAEANVSFAKVLPEAVPEGFSIKTNQLDKNGVYNCYLVPDNWAAPNAKNGTMKLDQVFNYGKGDAAKYIVTFEAAKMHNAKKVALDVQGDGSLTVASAFVDNTTKHNTEVWYNYGKISTKLVEEKSGDEQNFKRLAKSFPTIFSNIYNSTYSWHWATQKELGYTMNILTHKLIDADGNEVTMYSTEFEYGEKDEDKLTIELKNILGVSSRDAKYNAPLSQPYGKDETENAGTSLKIEAVHVLTTANNNVDEYIQIDEDKSKLNQNDGSGKIVLKSFSKLTNPVADVPSKLVITAKDMYNNEVTISLDITVKRRAN